MKSPSINDGIVICASKDFEAVAWLYDRIAAATTNKSFFNWDQKKALDELEKATTIAVQWRGEDGLHQIVAFLTYREYDDRFEISAIGTDLAFLKRGLAEKLLSHLKANAAQRNLPLWLEVHENNQTAINLYLKNGFAVLNTRKRYYPDGGSALVMQFVAG